MKRYRQTAQAIITALLLSILTLTGCSEKAPLQPDAMTRHALLHDGLEREYFVFRPSGYDQSESSPMLVFLHGFGGTATGTEAEVTQGLNRYAERYGYVVVYPQGTWFMDGNDPENQWEVTSWNHISDGFDRGPDGPICTPDAIRTPCPPECGSCGSCGWTSCNDDVGFLNKLFAAVNEELKVDPARQFIAGFSNGAMMANRYACDASANVAAVALVGGRVEPGFECMPTRPLPLLQINGGKDTTVPFDGGASHDGYFFASTKAIESHWFDARACNVERETWLSPLIAGENVQCTMACGDTAHPAIDCVWPEGNHRWPGTADFIGSNGYCVSTLQAKSMPEQTICIAPDDNVELWGSTLMFEFFDGNFQR